MDGKIKKRYVESYSNHSNQYAAWSTFVPYLVLGTVTIYKSAFAKCILVPRRG